MREIHLTQGFVTVVDDDDYGRLSEHKWHALNSHPRMVYAARWIKGTNPRQALRMHHAILQVDPEFLRRNHLVTDHIDRNSLNNQKENLRITTRRGNAINSERSDKAIGIYWDTVRFQYKAMQLQPHKRFIGWFNSFEDAVAVRAVFLAGANENASSN